ncbi:hypothetical protein THRCLA_03077 [Thraustotheca clavata]|uniref:PH domain-containing protein n=1 Tax=Thraustotheca clavata TaxID=74557 RepID=A0A1W0A366_9STRA|nr:hypothetical protein THRCLA_03077 [Thraustotheca clavata]
MQAALAPLCTESEGSWVLCEDTCLLLEAEKKALQKLSIVGVIDASKHPKKNANGLYMLPDPIKVDDDGTLTFLVVLQHNDLSSEPAWASLLFLLASHVIYVQEGHVYGDNFTNWSFLQHLLNVTVISDEEMSANPDMNTTVLKRLLPKLTIVPLDLEKRDCNGDSFAIYLEKALQTPKANYDYTSQALLNQLFVQRDCVGIKASTFKVPGMPHTAAKIMSLANDMLPAKALFGRTLCSGIFLHLLSALVVKKDESWNLRDITVQVSRAYWQNLLDAAITMYADIMHTKILPYDDVDLDNATIVALTEAKLHGGYAGLDNDDDVVLIDQSSANGSVVFDEYGNLKKSTANGGKKKTLDVGILTFMKTAKASLNRQMTMSAPKPTKANPFCDPYLQNIRDYEVPTKYISQYKRERLPLEAPVLDDIHYDCLSLATTLLHPFMALSIPYEDVCFAGRWSFAVGREHLNQAMQAIRRDFILANNASSAAFCTRLIQALHTAVLQKTQADEDKSKLVRYLIAYRSNIEALVSQYQFIAKGPMASCILASYLASVVRYRIAQAVKSSHLQFEANANELENTLNDTKNTLNELMQTIAQAEDVRKQCIIKEMQQDAAVEQRKQEQIATIQGAIAETQAQINLALREKEALFANTVQTTQATVATVEIIAKKPKEHAGYLFRQEGSGFFGQKWKQSYFVLKDGKFLCYKAKSYYEEARESMEPPLNVSGYTVLQSSRNANEFKLAPPVAGRTYCFRAPTDEMREIWVQKFNEASNYS